MRAGRPKGFDEEEVLGRAMEVFWRHGYRGTALTELLREMGISRQSLYDTFGNKRELFVRVLEHYRDTRLAEALALLERGGSRVDSVKAVVHFFQLLGQDSQCRGCLVANSLVELGPSEDVEIANLLRETLGLLQGGVERALRQAQAEGELEAGKSPVQISRALINAMVGMAVTGRLEMGQAGLADVYAGTLSMLD